MLLPALNLISLLIPNAAVLLFPAWFQPGKDSPQGIEATGILVGGGRIMDGAGADDDQQALILTGQNGFYIVAGIQQILGDGVV